MGILAVVRRLAAYGLDVFAQNLEVVERLQVPASAGSECSAAKLAVQHLAMFRLHVWCTVWGL